MVWLGMNCVTVGSKGEGNLVMDRMTLGQISPPILRISPVVVSPTSHIDIHSSALSAVYVTVLKFSGRK